VDDITCREWLNDEVIHAEQVLVKKDDDLLPVGGMLNALLGALMYDKARLYKSFTVLGITGSLHQYTMGVAHPHIRIYDSLQTSLPLDTNSKLLQCAQAHEDLFYKAGKMRSHLSSCLTLKRRNRA